MTNLPVAPLQKKRATVRLTNCDIEILDIALSGLSVSKIQEKLFISRGAVQLRLSKIYKKFGVIDRIGLVELASTQGLQYSHRGNEIVCRVMQIIRTYS